MVASADFENQPETGNSDHEFQSEPKGGDFQIERPDWTLFRSLGTLGQKAGVPAEKLRRLCLKELADNALDAGGRATITEPEPGHYVIEDDGPGIDGTPEEIARLFSIDRGLVSSKLWRKPVRGALGNGLRVVAGALISSGGGSLVVTTRNQRLTITPLEDGGADVVAEADDYSLGTCIEISFGPHLPEDEDDDALRWARNAIYMARHGSGYAGKPSPHCFDADAFYELVHCSGDRPVRSLIENFDGCTGAKASLIANRFLQRSCGSMTRNETTQLLECACSETTRLSAERLGAIGKLDAAGFPHYARERGTVEIGMREPKARIPFVVEAWVKSATEREGSAISIYVNRTPITGEAQVYFDSDEDFVIWGCNLLGYVINTPTKRGKWRLVLNVIAPYVPITTDGKEPDLKPFAVEIVTALSTVIKKAHRNAPKAEKVDSILPKFAKGAKSEETKAAELGDLLGFSIFLKEIAATLDFKVSSRGWAYVMEEHGLKKGEFDACQRLINICRKNGMLPYDFCADDARRDVEGVEAIDHENPDDEVAQAIEELLHRHEEYRPLAFWDTVDTYVEMAVEKVDLKQLFGPICAEHHVLISNTAGWSDINSRCAMMLRFKEQEAKGKRCVLLYCGDFDPGGLNISNFIRSNLADLSKAVGWSPDNLIIDRFGLNFDFIEKQGLTWIDNLETSTGGRLDDPNHRDHNKSYVQDYLEQYCTRDVNGKWQGRKVEANALVVRADAARQLCYDALAEYIDREALGAYAAEMAERREELRRKIAERLAASG